MNTCVSWLFSTIEGEMQHRFFVSSCTKDVHEENDQDNWKSSETDLSKQLKLRRPNSAPLVMLIRSILELEENTEN